jgi:hypothetical protein
MAKSRKRKHSKKQKSVRGAGQDPVVAEPRVEASNLEQLPFEEALEDADPHDLGLAPSQYSDDPDVVDDFNQRQQLNDSYRDRADFSHEHTSVSPVESAGDVDADWEDANESGDETLGGDSPTPDQDTVDDLGDAAGIHYQLEEPLHSDKIQDRDRNRWELNPASADEPDTPAEPQVPADMEDPDHDLHDLTLPKPKRRRGTRKK